MARLDFSKTHTGTETMIKFNYKLPKSAIFNPEKAQALFGTQMTSTINDIVSVIKINIQNEAPVGDTAQLRNTIGTTVSQRRGTVFTGVDYAIVVEQGRAAGKRQPPSDALINWLRRTAKGQSLFGKMKSKNPRITYKSAAYVLSRSIGKKGIKANPFFDRGINKSRAVISKLSRSLLKLITAGMVK